MSALWFWRVVYLVFLFMFFLGFIAKWDVRLFVFDGVMVLLARIELQEEDAL